MKKTVLMISMLALIVSLGACKNSTKNNEASVVESSANIESVDNSADLLEKYWKLVAINGEAIPVEGMGREAHIIFKTEANRVIGNGSCNTINGEYELKSGNGISISKVATTMMACPSMDIESKLLKSLETFDSYTIVADTLTLTGTSDKTSAKFEAVYL